MRPLMPLESAYGRLTVILHQGAYADCECACGSGVKRYPAAKLRSGNTRSCGCLAREMTSAMGKARRTHRMTGTSIYKTWTSIRDRCLNPSSKDYWKYGGRGITMCDRWRESFENFYVDVGDRPPGMTLDRRNNDGPYSPENCRWATCLEQTRNRRCSINLTFHGETKPLQQWCDEAGVPYSLVHTRVVRDGWPLDVALSKAARPLRFGLTAAAAPEVYRLRALGLKQRDIAAATGICQAQVSRLLAKAPAGKVPA